MHMQWRVLEFRVYVHIHIGCKQKQSVRLNLRERFGFEFCINYLFDCNSYDTEERKNLIEV